MSLQGYHKMPWHGVKFDLKAGRFLKPRVILIRAKATEKPAWEAHCWRSESYKLSCAHTLPKAECVLECGDKSGKIYLKFLNELLVFFGWQSQKKKTLSLKHTLYSTMVSAAWWPLVRPITLMRLDPGSLVHQDLGSLFWLCVCVFVPLQHSE